MKERMGDKDGKKRRTIRPRVWGEAMSRKRKDMLRERADIERAGVHEARRKDSPCHELLEEDLSLCLAGV